MGRGNMWRCLSGVSILTLVLVSQQLVPVIGTGGPSVVDPLACADEVCTTGSSAIAQRPDTGLHTTRDQQARSACKTTCDASARVCGGVAGDGPEGSVVLLGFSSAHATSSDVIMVNAPRTITITHDHEIEKSEPMPEEGGDGEGGGGDGEGGGGGGARR